MGGGTSKPQPQIRTYVAGELAEVTESTDGSRSSALRSEKSNYSAPGNPAQPTKGPGKVAFAEPDPDSPGHLSEAPTTPSESPGGTWQDPTAGYMSPTTDAATSPAGVPGGVPTLVPLSKTTIDPLSKLDNRRGSLIDGSVESELSALRSELVSQRKATESLASEMRSMKSQMNSQLANLTHIVMLMSNSSGTAGGSSARVSSNSGRETRGDAEESPGTGTEGGPSPAVRQRTKSGKDRGRRMSLNALTTAGV